jgi:hypothetical protein
LERWAQRARAVNQAHEGPPFLHAPLPGRHPTSVAAVEPSTPWPGSPRGCLITHRIIQPRHAPETGHGR